MLPLQVQTERQTDRQTDGLMMIADDAFKKGLNVFYSSVWRQTDIRL